jgi:hypothetical protein
MVRINPEVQPSVISSHICRTACSYFLQRSEMIIKQFGRWDPGASTGFIQYAECV